MSVDAWGICKPKYARTAFDGAGAARAPGRWNRGGQKVVYTSDSQSLATLELLVHADVKGHDIPCHDIPHPGVMKIPPHQRGLG